jgi:hypothetical protein
MNENLSAVSGPRLSAYQFNDNVGRQSPVVALGIDVPGGSKFALHRFSYYLVCLGRIGATCRFGVRGWARNNWLGDVDLYDTQHSRCSRRSPALVVSSLAVTIWHMQVSERLAGLTGLHRTLPMLCSGSSLT